MKTNKLKSRIKHKNKMKRVRLSKKLMNKRVSERTTLKPQTAPYTPATTMQSSFHPRANLGREFGAFGFSSQITRQNLSVANDAEDGFFDFFGR